MKNSKIDFTGMMMMLKDLGVDLIEVRYDGSGDSGEIEDISYLRSGGEYVTNPKLAEYRIALENFCYEKLLDNIGDWCNNDGGYGTIIIQVPSGEYKLDNHIRVVSTEDEEYEGNIQDKMQEEEL